MFIAFFFDFRPTACSLSDFHSNRMFVFRLSFEPLCLFFLILIRTTGPFSDSDSNRIFRFWFKPHVRFQSLIRTACSFSDSDSYHMLVYRFWYEPRVHFQILIRTGRSFFRFRYAAITSQISFRFMKDASIRFKLYFINLMHKKNLQLNQKPQNT